MGRFCRGKATVLVDITKVNKKPIPSPYNSNDPTRFFF